MKKPLIPISWISFFICTILPFIGSCNANTFSLCNRNQDLGIAVEARVAYYHPSSKKVKDLYGDGWADYQLEISKKLNINQFWSCKALSDIEWLLCAAVSGFSREGSSIPFHDKTNLQLIPVNIGMKVLYPIMCNTKVYIGGSACYSMLRIHDDSHYVYEHTNKNAWGGLFQSGITYDFCNNLSTTAFFDYYFQEFHFNSTSFEGSSSYPRQSNYIERSNLNMNGYKVGVSLAIAF